MIVALIFAALLIAWGASGPRFSGSGPGSARRGSGPRWREPRARLLLRAGFGLLWLFDGLLQAQPQMPGGLADQVIQPSAASLHPGWVQAPGERGREPLGLPPDPGRHGGGVVQAGIGLWMIVAVRGRSARLAGLAGAAWGLAVWVFGEAFGGIFAPGLTVLFGAPGAALLYVVAGALLALPERAWDGPRLGRLLLGAAGAFLLGMALLQAWPGRGFWQGTTGPARDAHRHDRRHGGHVAAVRAARGRRRVRPLHRGPRVRGQPHRGGRAHPVGAGLLAAAVAPTRGWRWPRSSPAPPSASPTGC